MKLLPALIASAIGIYLLSVVAAVYVGARMVGRLPGLLSFHGSPYYQHWRTGDDDMSQRDYVSAMREYGEMVALRPYKVEGYTYRAIAESRAGLYDRAIQDDTKGLDLLTQRKGIEEQGAPEEMNYQDQRISVPASQARLYNGRGFAYFKLGNIPLATRDFKQAISLRPDRDVYYGSLSELYQQTAEFRLDVANWKTAIMYNVDDYYCWCNYGWALYRAGDLPKAIDADLYAIRIHPRAVTARFNLALAYAVQGRWALAEPIYRKAISRRDFRLQAIAAQHLRDALKAHPGSESLQKAAALLGSS